MKLRVVGWTYYDEDLMQGDISWAARNAIVDDIKAHGYRFSGWSHQEAYCCTPVLNDGKMYCFTQRGWGGVMAEAHGYTGRMDYAKFTFAGNLDDEIRPPQILFDVDEFTPESDLNERFVLEVSQDDLSSAKRNCEIKLDDLPQLRYIDVGDTLELISGKNSATFTVADVERKKDLTEERLRELRFAFYDFMDMQKMQEAEEEFARTKAVIIIKLKQQ